jgi:hypothetical protein
MTTLEVLRFLELQGFKMSSWRLQNLIKRGVINQPIKIFRNTTNGEYYYPANVIARIKLFLQLNECKKRRQIGGGMAL